MVWPIIIVIVVIALIAVYMYKKDQGKRGYALNRLCLTCHKRYPDTLSACPNCGEKYF